MTWKKDQKKWRWDFIGDHHHRHHVRIGVEILYTARVRMLTAYHQSERSKHACSKVRHQYLCPDSRRQ